MDCPICQYKGLDDDAAFCPSCKTDLSAFQAMNAINSSYKKQKMISMIFIILFSLALIACVVIFFFAQPKTITKVDDQKLTQCQSSLQTLTTENKQLKDKVITLEKEISSLKTAKAPAKPEVISHIVVEGETLYLIAGKYLGNGKLYKKIAKDNNIDDPNVIIPGQEIIIRK